MSGQPFTHLRYISGDADIGPFRRMVTLVAHATHLEIQDRKTQAALTAVPWTNIERIEMVPVEKGIGGKIWADMLAEIFNTHSGYVTYGLSMTFVDVDRQRMKNAVFLVGSIQRFNLVADYIMQCRDAFVGGSSSTIEFRD